MKYKDKMVSLSCLALVLAFFVLPGGEYIAFLLVSGVFAMVGGVCYED